MADKLYHVKGREIFKESVATDNEDGSKNYTLGFAVCTVSEWVSPEQVADILEVGSLYGAAFAGFTGDLSAVQEGDFQQALDMLAAMIDDEPTLEQQQEARAFLARLQPEDSGS